MIVALSVSITLNLVFVGLFVLAGIMWKKDQKKLKKSSG